MYFRIVFNVNVLHKIAQGIFLYRKLKKYFLRYMVSLQGEINFFLKQKIWKIS